MWELSTAVRSGKVVKPVLLDADYRVPKESQLDGCIRGLQYVRWDPEQTPSRLVEECSETLQHALLHPRLLPPLRQPVARLCQASTAAPGYEVLFSYCTTAAEGSQAGEALMLRIKDALLERGLVGLHCGLVPGGTNWRLWWCETAKRCGVVVPILSPSFWRSRPCREELTFAYNHGCILIPVLGEPFVELPPDMEMMLQSSNRIPDRGSFEERFDANLAQLANDIWFHLRQRQGGLDQGPPHGLDNDGHHGVPMGHNSAPTACERPPPVPTGGTTKGPSNAAATQRQACAFCTVM